MTLYLMLVYLGNVFPQYLHPYRSAFSFELADGEDVIIRLTFLSTIVQVTAFS